MLEYLPWAQSTLDNALKKYSKNTFSILDVELGGECNYHCVYCDSPDRKKKCKISMVAFENIIKSNSFDWLFVCGLGEPTFNHNYDILVSLLNLCQRYGVKCSIFSNLSNLTPELIEFVKSKTLYILFKYDSAKIRTVNTLYGIKDASKQIEAVKSLAQYVHVEDGCTNLAASIVPTRMNYDDVITIVKECIELNIFPLLGELEYSGKGEINYENLYLTPDDLNKIKHEIEILLGGEYRIPICPAVINGIHFSADSYITVDNFSGLSCHWFWLEEPKTYKILKFEDSSSLPVITEAIFSYRNKRISYIENYIKYEKDIGSAFGGCGGKISTIFNQYLEFHKER